MRAVRIEQPGSPSGLRIAEVEDRVPGTGEVLVDVRASALNRADWLQIGQVTLPAGHSRGHPGHGVRGDGARDRPGRAPAPTG